MDNSYYNLMELVNELLVLMTFYSMICFSEFNLDVESRAQIGNIFYFTIFAIIGLNLIVIAVLTI